MASGHPLVFQYVSFNAFDGEDSPLMYADGTAVPDNVRPPSVSTDIGCSLQSDWVFHPSAQSTTPEIPTAASVAEYGPSGVDEALKRPGAPKSLSLTALKYPSAATTRPYRPFTESLKSVPLGLKANLSVQAYFDLIKDPAVTLPGRFHDTPMLMLSAPDGVPGIIPIPVPAIQQ